MPSLLRRNRPESEPVSCDLTVIILELLELFHVVGTTEVGEDVPIPTFPSTVRTPANVEVAVVEVAVIKFTVGEDVEMTAPVLSVARSTLFAKPEKVMAEVTMRRPVRILPVTSRFPAIVEVAVVEVAKNEAIVGVEVETSCEEALVETSMEEPRPEKVGVVVTVIDPTVRLLILDEATHRSFHLRVDVPRS